VKIFRDSSHGRAGHGSLRTATIAGLVALIVLLVGSAAKDWQTGLPGGRMVLAIVFSLAFVFPAVISIRAFAVVVDELARRRGGPEVGGAIRMIITISGYIVAGTCALGLTRYPLDHLLLGGAIVGVILGIAAQQSLGNVFAGLVLLAARPFRLGHHIRVRSGALGGEFEGTVISMSVTYVTLVTNHGPLKVPNSAMLAAAVGAKPPRDQSLSKPVSETTDAVQSGRDTGVIELQ
jgi:small-conductance mechanosensitive channel